MQRRTGPVMTFMGQDVDEILNRTLNGAIGLAKATVGIDRADDSKARNRLETCRSCPSGLYSGGLCSVAGGGCGCVLSMKVQIDGERCPKGHW